MTSASAQEVTASFSQTVEAPVVGATAPFTQLKDAKKVKIASSVSVNAAYGESDTEAEIEVPVEDVGTLDNDEEGKGSVKLSIFDSFDSDTGAFNYKATDLASSAASIDVSGKKIKFKIPKTAFGEGNKIENVCLRVKYGDNKWANGSESKSGEEGEYTNTTSNYITVNKTTPDPATDPNPAEETPVAAGDVFQIPAGLAYTAAKGSNPEVLKGYKVGVAKIVATPAVEATLGDNEVDWATIKQTADANDNTLGTWDGTEATKPTPANSTSTFIGKNVLYYENEKGVKTFVRILSDTETAKLPKAYKTVDTLTGTASSEGKAYTAGDDATLEKKNLNDAIKTALSSYLFGSGKVTYTAPNAYFTSSVDLGATDAVAAKKITDTETVQPGQVALSEIPAVKKEKTLVALYLAAADADAAKETVVGQLIDAYDNTDAGKANAFLEDTNLYTAATENAAASITPDGLTELANILAADPAAYLADDDQFKAVVKRTTENYLNGLNDEIYQNGAGDPAGLQWTLETDEDDYTTVTKNNKETKVYTKDNGNAKFYAATKAETVKKVFNSKTKVYETKEASSKDKAVVSRVKGATATIVSTKANGKFNNTVVLKAVTDDYVTPSARNTEAQAANVVFTEKFYVTPALPTLFNTKTIKEKTATGIEFKGGEGNDTTAGSENYVYNLSVDVNKGYKIPFALKDGQEKDLVYEIADGAKGFTVINGKVTGTAVGEGVVKVFPRVYGTFENAPKAARATVNVTVNAAYKSITANTKTVSVWPGSVQIISLGTVPASNCATAEFKVTSSDSNIKVLTKAGGALGTDGALTGNEFMIKGGESVPNNAVITVTGYGKTVKINAKKATAPADVTGVKAATKGKEITKEADGTAVINIPVGGSFNVGYAVTPATADANINAKVYDDELTSLEADYEAAGDEDKAAAKTAVEEKEANLANIATVSGDVITANGAGTVKVKFSPNGNIGDAFKSKISDNKGVVEYTVNVYNPGSTVTLPDTHVLRGGILMEAGNAASECVKEVPVGKTIRMTAPSNEKNEPMTWKSNNPVGLSVVEDEHSILFIKPAVPGKYTVTGTTKFTKQSIKFTVVVGANTVEDATTAVTAPQLTITNANGTEAETMNVGDKLNAFMYTSVNGAGGKVSFKAETVADGVATVNGKGVITAKKAGTVKITATMKCGEKEISANKTITINAKPITFTKVTVPVSATADKQFSVSAAIKNADKNATIKWMASKKNGDNWEEATEAGTGKSAKISLKAGTYKIQCVVNGTTSSAEQTIVVYEKTGSAIASAYTFKTDVATDADKKTKDDAKAADNKNNNDYKAIFKKWNTNSEGMGAGAGTYYVPLFVKVKGSDNKAVDAKIADLGGVDDITWTSSNSYLAKAETVPSIPDDATEEGLIKAAAKKATAVAKITVTNTNGTGKVTLTGTTKNGKKTIKVNLYVVAGNRTAPTTTEPAEAETNVVEAKLYAETETNVTIAEPAITLTSAGSEPENPTADQEYVYDVKRYISTSATPTADTLMKISNNLVTANVVSATGKTTVDITSGMTANMTKDSTYYVVEAVTKKKYVDNNWAEQATVYTVIGKGIKVTAIQPAITNAAAETAKGSALTSGIADTFTVSGVLKDNTGKYFFYTKKALDVKETRLEAGTVAEDGKLPITATLAENGNTVQIYAYLGYKADDNTDPVLAYDGVFKIGVTKSE